MIKPVSKLAAEAWIEGLGEVLIELKDNEIARLTARVVELEGVLDAVVQWADRHGKDPDWLEAARAAITQETRDE